jgi:parallel beta-helix repeat protein
MRIRKWRYLLLAGVAALSVAPFLSGAVSASGSGSKPPPPPQPNTKLAPPKSAPIATTAFACGEVAMASLTLTADENCPGSTAIWVGKAGITINLGGHTLTGDGTNSTFGVYDSGFSGVTITNGVINDFNYGVVLGAATSHVTSVVSENNTNAGIYVVGNSDTISGSSALSNAVVGFEIFNGSSNQVTNNTSESGPYGFYLVGLASVVISGNKALNSTGGSGYGMVVAGDSGTLTGNVANGNNVDGFYLSNAGTGVKPAVTATGNRAAFNAGLGFDSTPGGVFDGGGNVVQDNTNLLQCANIVCHEVGT